MKLAWYYNHNSEWAVRGLMRVAKASRNERDARTVYATSTATGAYRPKDASLRRGNKLKQVSASNAREGSRAGDLEGVSPWWAYVRLTTNPAWMRDVSRDRYGLHGGIATMNGG